MGSLRRLGLGAVWLVACAPSQAGNSVTPSPEAAPEHTQAPTSDPAAGVSPIHAPPVRPRLQASAAGCMEGAQTLTTPGVCLKVPSGYEISSRHPADITLEHDGGPPIFLQWGSGSASLLDDLRQGLEHLAAQDPDAVVGETCDGRGAFVYAAQHGPGKSVGAPEVRRAISVGRSPQGLLVRCSVEVSAADPVSRALFEACQTLGFPKP